MTELIPRLFIGNWHEARSSVGMHVVTVAVDSEYIGHRHYHLIDGPGNNQDVFDSAVAEVCRAYSDGSTVLVHCGGGRSRSAAVIVAAATKLTGRPMCQLYDELLHKHDGTGTGARIHPFLAVLLLEHMKST